MGGSQHPWDAERVVPLAEARALIAAAAPELAGSEVEAFGAGWDNTAYLVDGTWLFRFPRRQLAAPFMETEIRVLPRLAARLSLRIPEPEYAGDPSEEYPWRYAGYRLLEGEIAAEREIPAEALAVNAERLGALLAELHAQPADEWRRVGVPGDELRRLDRDHRVPLARSKLRELEEQAVLTDVGWIRKIIDESLPASWGDTAPRLVHGDFDARHLLVDRNGLVTGVIDWGDIHLGNPAVDLAIAHTFFPAPMRKAFLSAYGPIPDDIWRAARFRAVHNSLHVLDWALQTGKVAIERSARLWLRHISMS